MAVILLAGDDGDQVRPGLERAQQVLGLEPPGAGDDHFAGEAGPAEIRRGRLVSQRGRAAARSGAVSADKRCYPCLGHDPTAIHWGG
jgi:hypothetical protein